MGRFVRTSNINAIAISHGMARAILLGGQVRIAGAILAFLAPLLSACGAATAGTPDSSNSAHCVAAFAYARMISSSAKVPNISLSVQSTARALFEGKKMKANGTFETGQKEGEDFYATYGKNDDAMFKLVGECSKKQDVDPDFRAMNANGTLMAAARKVDPLCQANQACRNQ